MIKLAILADDFTGALDTAVQFSSRGIETSLQISNEIPGQLKPDCQVLAVNLETRHLSAQSAYESVYKTALAFRTMRVPYLYIKVDSGLRGNVGASLAAAISAWGQSVLLSPAYPDAGRVVQDGLLYIRGTPISRSCFAEDLFNPILRDRISDILKSQTDRTVSSHAGPADNAIVPKDAQSNDDLRQIAWRAIRRDKFSLLAGSAGLARFLPEILQIESERVRVDRLPEPLLVISGSASRVSVEQLRYAQEHGFRSIALEGIASERPALGKLLRDVKAAPPRPGILIEASNTPISSGGAAADRTRMAVGRQIASNLGKAAASIVNEGFDGTLFIFGFERFDNPTDLRSRMRNRIIGSTDRRKANPIAFKIWKLRRKRRNPPNLSYVYRGA